MKETSYNAVFKDFEITHAHIYKANEIAFITQTSQPATEIYKQREELPTRIIIYLPAEQEKNDGFAFREVGFGIRYGYIYLSPTHYIVAESFGKVLESRTDNTWHSIVDTNPDKSKKFLTGIKKIGNTVFASGSERKIYRRNEFNNWKDLVDEDQHGYVYSDIYEREKKGIKHIGYPMGFSCFDGFHEEDIYAGSRHGGLWRYNGKQWFRIDLPTNSDIADIVCAPNGKAYICLASGGILIGREDQWNTLDSRVDNQYIFAADVKSAAWFQEKLYLSTPFDLYVLDDEKFKKYQFPKGGHRQSSFGWITACDEALLSYGNNQALIFDGETWTEIVNTPVLAQ